MKRKTLKIVLVVLILGGLLFILTGCSNENTKNEQLEDTVIDNAEEKEESKTSTKVKFNPELEGVYAFGITKSSLMALKKDGTTVEIMNEPDINGNCYFTAIEYCAGNIYIARSYVKQTGTTRTTFPPVINHTYETTNYTFYKVDLNKGDGNYELELVYDYKPERSITTESPIVYNNILYFLKNGKDVVQYNIATKEEITIHEFERDDFAPSIKMNKENATLYYVGQSEDKSTSLYSYDLNTLEEKKLVDNVYDIKQVTEKGVYYSIKEENNFYSKFYDIENATSEDMDQELNYTTYKVCGENIYFMEDTEEMGYFNFVVKDKDGNKTTLVNNMAWGSYDGIYLWGDTIQAVLNNESYYIDNENLTMEKQDVTYQNIVSVDKYSNINTNIIPDEENSNHISKEQAKEIAVSIWGEEENGNQMIYNDFGWVRDEEGTQYYVFNIKWNTGEVTSWIGTVGISFDGKTYRELNDPGYSLHSGDIQRDMYEAHKIGE